MENLVNFVKSSFFKVRRFQDQEDLQQQLLEWHQEVNQEPLGRMDNPEEIAKAAVFGRQTIVALSPESSCLSMVVLPRCNLDP